MGNSLIRLEGISKSFNKKTVLSEINLSLEGGKFYVLLGRNGVGKSTLMKIIMRNEMFDSGQGWVFDQALDKDNSDLNYEIGYVSESINFQIPLKIKKLFSYFSQIYPKWDALFFEDILERLKIDPNKLFQELSRGQKMQVAFASALSIKPKLILLDEITSVLDSNARSYFMDYLKKFTIEGGTVLMATNIVSEVNNYADHIVLLDNAKVRLDLSLNEISKKFRKLRKKPELDHPVFKDIKCVEVGINSDKSTSYLILANLADGYNISEELCDNRGIMAEELFIYFTRSEAA